MRKKLSIENPTILEEWDYEANGNLNPDDYTGGSNKKVWWKCKLGHTWYAQINKRLTFERNCPYCSGNKVWQGFNDIPTTHPHIAAEWDYDKNESLRPEQFSIGADRKIWWKCKCGHSWNALIYSRKNHGCPACAGNILVAGVNDLLTVNPTVAAEWDNAKNNPLRPDSVAANDGRKAWWLCGKGHSWEAVISSRNSGKGCPYCNHKYVLAGFNDLATITPSLLEEWDYEQNAPLRPEDVMNSSHRYVWWKCNRGHSWQSTVANRSYGFGCPYCAGKRPIVGETDLKTRYPDVCKEWDNEKNGQVTPDKIACHSHKRYWWICPKGHSYQASSTSRIRSFNEGNGNGCPYCAGKRPIIGETDFRTIHPELMSEWDFEKNGNRRPEDFTAGSHKKVWWKCKEGHSWKTAIYNRHIGNGCHVCGILKDKHIVIPGVNDLASKFPHIAEQWNYDLNGNLTPQQVMPGSNKKVWWTCNRGHSWLASVLARTYGTKCPYCNVKFPARTKFIT